MCLNQVGSFKCNFYFITFGSLSWKTYLVGAKCILLKLGTIVANRDDGCGVSIDVRVNLILTAPVFFRTRMILQDVRCLIFNIDRTIILLVDAPRIRTTMALGHFQKRQAKVLFLTNTITFAECRTCNIFFGDL